MELRSIALWLSLGSLIFSPVSSAGAHGIDTENELPIFDLGQIEVVGEREKVDLTCRSIINEEEFDRKLNQSVVEAVEKAPGIITTVGSKNEPQVLLRGFDQQKILILADGVPLSAPYYGDLDTSELPLDNLAEIKIIRGNSSVLYGPNALGGVVSLISAKPGSDPYFRFTGSIDQEAGYHTRLGHGARYGDFYYQVSAGLRQSDGWPLAEDFETTVDDEGNVLEDGAVRDHSSFHQWSAGLKVGWDVGQSEFSLATTYVDAEKDIPSATTDQVRVRYWDFPVWQKATAILAGRSLVHENIELRANLFYHKYDNILRNYKDSEYHDIKWESTFDDYSAGFSTRLSWLVTKSFTLRSSVLGILDNHRAQADRGESWSEYEARTYSLSSEGEWKPFPNWVLQVGFGLELYDFESVHNIAGSADSITNRTKDVHGLTFNVGGEYKVTDKQKITLAIGKKNRFPTMHQLFSNIEEYAPEDVSSLDPEQALQYHLGYSLKQSEEYQFGTAVFYYDIDDLIQRPNSDGLYYNVEQALINGLELWGRYGQDTGLFAQFAYTYLQATNESHDTPERDLAHVPEHLVHGELGYIFQWGTSVMLDFTFHDEVVEYDGADRWTIPAYILWDLSLRHDFESGVSFSLQATNLLDENYYQEFGYAKPGRIIKLGFHYKI